MPWKHVYSPSDGMITNAPPSGIKPTASPYIKGCYIKDGEVISDYGTTAFPAQGLLKTNKLHGVPMKIDQLYLNSGLGYMFCLTTTNAYLFNDTTLTWDCVTKGILVDGCESAWAASANVTSTADTAVKLRGTYSAKHVIATAFGTGIASTFDFGAVDCTAATALHFWIYSTVATAAGDLKVGISETAVCAAGVLYFNVPALVANTWTPCCVAGSFSGYNAVISECLNVVTDLGAMTVYLDDVRAVTPFTGDEDNRFSTAPMNNLMVVTNGVDQPQSYAGGSALFVDAVTTLGAGSITTSEIVFAFKDHLFYMNNTENSVDCPARASWTNVGSTTDLINGTAGYQDLTDDVSWIIGVAILSENEAIIYKERAIVSLQWIGGQTPFRFKTMVMGTGCLSKDAIDSGTGEHMVVGPDLTYAYKGGTEIEILDDKVKKTMYGRLNRGYVNRLFLLYIEEDDELQLWMPTEETTPDEVWCQNVISEVWFVRRKAMTCAGYYQEASSFTIGSLTGNIGEQNWRFGDALVKAYAPTTLVGSSDGCIYKIDKTSLNNNGVAIVNEFQTPDFVAPDSSSYMDIYMQVSQLIYEAGGHSLTTEYSLDSGSSWSPTQGAGGNTVSLTSTHKDYQQDFSVATKKIRFRFMNSLVSSGFNLRYFGFYWEPRSGRG